MAPPDAATPKKNNKPQFLEGNQAAYDINAPCGQCIASGYNFCWKSEESGLILTDDQYPTATGVYETTNTMCCGEQSWYDDYKMENGGAFSLSTETDDEKLYPNRNCAMLMKNSRVADKIGWRCSQAYTNTAYATLMCPYRRSAWGPNKVINFYTDQDDGAIHVIGLKKGESCVYNIESVCGGPSFNIQNSSDVEVFFAEWQQDSVAMVTPVSNKPMSSEELVISSPLQDYPTRNVDF